MKDVGVQPGMKWCLCVHRWQEAYDAYKDGKLGKEAVPKVFLHASHESALQKVSYKQLKEFASEQEAATQPGRQDTHQNPEGPGGISGESVNIGGDMGKTAPSKSGGGVNPPSSDDQGLKGKGR